MAARLRETGNKDVPTYVDSVRQMFFTGGPPITDHFIGARIGSYASMSDVVTPGFARRRNNREIINNPMSRIVYTYSALPMTSIWTESVPHAPYGTRIRQEIYGLHAAATQPLHPPNQPGNPAGDLLHNWVPMLDVDSLRSRAATAALSDSNGKSAQGLVIIAEMQKTLNTLRNPLKAAREALRKMPAILKSKDGRNKPLGVLKNVASGASNQYLTWFYGIRTIMFDIDDIKEALGKKITDRVTGRGFSDDSTFSLSSYDWTIGGIQQVTETLRYDELIEFRAGALCQIEAITNTSQDLGLSLRKIPEAAWELMPWSFVVDWFVNVQENIGALEAILHNKFLAQWVTQKITVKWTRTNGSHIVLPGDPYSTVITTPCQDSDMVIVEMYDRVPINLGQFIRPTLKLSLQKVPTLAAISLVVQQLTKR